MARPTPLPRRLAFSLFLAALVACGDDAAIVDAAADTPIDAGNEDAADGGMDASSTPLRVRVTREPAEGLDAFVIHVSGANSPPTIDVAQGTMGEVEAQMDGSFTLRVTPTITGEHPFEVHANGETIARTALVLHDVADGWGQPMAVAGLVNTEGYEDGVTITPDGEYLFVQYGPFYFSGLFVFDAPRDNGGCGGHRLQPTRCTHSWIDETIGPYDAPARPGFPSGRIDAEGRWRHNSALYQVPDDGTPNFALSTMFYGFRRQPDGSFGEPFRVGFDDGGDALGGPFGLSFLPRTDSAATVLFAFNDPAPGPFARFGDMDIESGFDVYSIDLPLGVDASLGELLPGAMPLAIEHGDFPARRLGFDNDGVLGTQGNPHLFAIDDAVHSVWTDDEYDANPAGPSHDDHEALSVYVLDGGYPEGPWTKVVLPAPIRNEQPNIQPTFVAHGEEHALYFTRDLHVVRSTYAGPLDAAGFANGSHWSEPETLLTRDPGPVVQVAALGEPTVAHYDGRDWLYFVYAIIRGTDPVTGLPDINLQAGYVAQAE